MDFDLRGVWECKRLTGTLMRILLCCYVFVPNKGGVGTALIAIRRIRSSIGATHQMPGMNHSD